MRALNRVPATPKPTSKRARDIEVPRYPRRIACEVTGIDVEVLKQWQFRNLLDHCRWDGVLIRQQDRQTTLRRYYSVLDLLKLSVMQELVQLGVRVEVAAEAPALIEVVLSGEDLNALERGRLPEHPLLFAKVAEDAFELAFFVSRSGATSPWSSAEEALRQSPVCAGVLIDWPGLVGRVFEELRDIDRMMGRT